MKWKGCNSSFNSYIDKEDNINEGIFSKTEILWRKSESSIKFIYFATKADLINATGVDTSKFGKKVHLANLKSEVDKLDVDK